MWGMQFISQQADQLTLRSDFANGRYYDFSLRVVEDLALVGFNKINVLAQDHLNRVPRIMLVDIGQVQSYNFT